MIIQYLINHNRVSYLYYHYFIILRLLSIPLSTEHYILNHRKDFPNAIDTTSSSLIIYTKIDRWEKHRPN